MQPQRGGIVGLICLFWLPWAATAQVHHDLNVTLQPDVAGIEVHATITLPDTHPSSLIFALHPALEPQLQGDKAQLIELPQQTDNSQPALHPTAISPRRYRVNLAPGENSFTLHYTGSIAHALQARVKSTRAASRKHGASFHRRACFSPAPASGTRISKNHCSHLTLKCIYRRGGKA